MDCVNHWIPRPSFQTRLYHLHPCRRACAGRLRASSAARSRRGSTSCIHAGVPSRRIQDFLSINDGAFYMLPSISAPCRFSMPALSLSPALKTPDYPARAEDELPTTQPLRHSGEGRNPVVLIRHPRASGGDNPTLMSSGLAQTGAACTSPSIPAPLSSAACSRRRSLPPTSL